jgi:hypothetical protein
MLKNEKAKSHYQMEGVAKVNIFCFIVVYSITLLDKVSATSELQITATNLTITNSYKHSFGLHIMYCFNFWGLTAAINILIFFYQKKII